jgi:hypothetical protein
VSSPHQGSIFAIICSDMGDSASNKSQGSDLPNLDAAKRRLQALVRKESHCNRSHKHISFAQCLRTVTNTRESKLQGTTDKHVTSISSPFERLIGAMFLS